MNNQEFDDAIRKKLEGVGQTFTEADIDKVFQHVTTAKPTIWQWLRGHWYLPAITMVSITAVVVLLFLNRSEKSEVKEMPAKEVAARVSPASTDAQQSAPDTVKAVPAEIGNLPSGNAISDTLSADHYTQSESEKLNLNTGQTTKRTKQMVKSEAKSDIRSYYADTPVTEAAANERPVLQASAQEIISEKQEKPVQEKLADTSSRYQPVNDEEVSAVPEAGLKTKENDLVIAEPPMKNTAKPDSKLGDEPGIKKKITISKPELKGLNLSGTYALGNLGYGPALNAKLLFGKGFGFATGVRYLTTYKEQFNSREELEKDRHHHVHPGIKDRFHENDMFSDIVIKNQLLQVPLMLTYSLPLKKKFTLDFQLGTEWDVYINQKIDLEQRTDSSGKHPGHFRGSGNAVPFNNIVFSAGISRQWGKFSFHVSPFVSPGLKNVFYKPKEIEFGVSAGVGYRLGK
jgi:hypothetical protein